MNDGNSDLKKHEAGIQLVYIMLSNDMKPPFINYMDRKNIFTSIQASGDNTEDRQQFVLQMQFITKKQINKAHISMYCHRYLISGEFN